MNTPCFTSILYVDHAELFPAALSAFTAQEPFRSNGQLIIVTPEDKDALRQAVERAKGKLAIPPVYLVQAGCSMAQAYNLGLAQAEGQWLNFTLASSTFSGDAFAQLARAAENHSTIRAFSLRPMQVGDESDIPYLIAPKSEGDVSVSLDRQYKQLQLVLQAYFFRRDILNGLTFDETIRDDALHKYLLLALLRTTDESTDLKAPSFRFLANAYYRYHVPLEDNAHASILQHQKWWYSDSVREFMIPFLRSFSDGKESIPAYIQHACIWLIGAKYRCNFNDFNKHMLNREEYDEFYQLCSQAMVYLDNRFILQRGYTPPVTLSMAFRTTMLRGKAEQMGCKLHLTASGQEFIARFQKKDGTPWDGRPDDDLAALVMKDRIRFEVRLIKFEDDCLVFNGFLFGRLLLTGEPFQMYALSWMRGKDPAFYEKIPGQQADVFCLKKDFGRVIMKDYPVTFRIPLRKGKMQKIRFYLDIAGAQVQLTTTYPRARSRLRNYPDCYWQFTNRRVLVPEANELGQIKELHVINNASRKGKLKREWLFRKAFLANEAEKGDWHEVRRALRMRLLYFLTRPFYRNKRIWVSFDKLYKAGDNGEYMYQYVRQKHGQAGAPECYYIIQKTCPDYPRMKAQPHAKLLIENSLKCFLTCMNAEVILATHSNVFRYVNESDVVGRCMRDRYHSKVVCIQHGLSINQIAHFQNQWFDDTELYTCASPFEKENLSSKYYGYQDKQLQLTGLARYDGLKDKNQKFILITPTWRKEVAVKYVFGEKRGYNPQFKDSAYYHIYNTLINDPRLLETAKRTGYRIMYLLHPATSSQLPDFKDNGYVELVAATGDMSYEKVLTEASLMVTDYSGVQFDFAYQRKPLVYYHPDALPPHYEEGGLIYDTMGFGPICKNNDEIVDTLCQYMESGCKMEPEYVQRADNFFAHRDFKNCERIYLAVEEMLHENRNNV